MISCDTPCCFCQCNSFKFRAYSIKYFRSNRSMFSLRWVSFFRPPTKLWEGNIFIRVCMSFSPRGPLHTAPARSLSTIKGPLALIPASHTWWSRPEICSNFYTLRPPIPLPLWYWHLVAEARTVGEQAVCILLECFLVSNMWMPPTCSGKHWKPFKVFPHTMMLLNI